MSEQENESWALTPYASSSPVLVQVVSRQLAIQVRWDWTEISKNQTLPWSADLI